MDPRLKARRLRELLTSQGDPADLGLESLISTLPTATHEAAESLDLATASVRALRDGAPLGAAQLEQLEAIVMPYQRPVARVRHDLWEPLPGMWSHLDDDPTRARLRPVLRAVGRINVPRIPTRPYAGTGFLVGRGLLLTNRHVAHLFCQGLRTELRFEPADSGAEIDFVREYDVAIEPSTSFRVVGVRWIHPWWDAALVQIEGDLADRTPLVLQAEPPGDLAGRDVVVIGYPARDARNDLVVQDRVFQSIYQVKRFQPGRVRGAGRALSGGHEVDVLVHDASTLGGNSGSAVVDLATGGVLGLHFGGEYLVGNHAVSAWDLAMDAAHVQDMGVQVSGVVPQAAPAWLEHWQAGGEAAAASASTEAPSGLARRTLVADWWDRLDDGALRRVFAEDPRGAAEVLAEQLPDPADREALLDGLVDVDGAGALSDGREHAEAPARPGPGAPILVYVHGIMGCHLRDSLGGDHLWLNPPRTLFTDLGPRLSLREDGQTDLTWGRLGAAGHLGMFYRRAERRWLRAGIDVRPFSYDWRKSIGQAADELQAWLSATLPEGRKAWIVAHSMGGLVTMAWRHRHPQSAQRLLAGAVLVGSPLHGAYAPVLALLGRYPLLTTLAKATASTRDSLRAMARTLPGMIDMLPDPAVFADAGGVYRAEAWPAPFQPAQRWLDQSAALKRALADPALRRDTTLIVNATLHTVDSMPEDGDAEGPVPARGRGDGTVPIAGALLEGVPVLHATGRAHDKLMLHEGVIHAVRDLVLEGATTALPVFDPLRPPPLEEAPALESLEGPSLEEQSRLDRVRRGELHAGDITWLFDTTTGPPAPPRAEVADPQRPCDLDGEQLESLVEGVAVPPEPSGPWWCARYPASRSVEALAEPFRTRVQAFLAALTGAGAEVEVLSTWRAPERAWLMHHAWAIARDQADPAAVAPHASVRIQWDHGDLDASRQAAEAMVQGYAMRARPALWTRHIAGKAIDLRARWTAPLTLVDGAGQPARIEPGDSSSSEALWALGASYGVFHLAADPPHWSADGG
jgi:pimeloyl-ACP methyl ester carboxylesterase